MANTPYRITLSQAVKGVLGVADNDSIVINPTTIIPDQVNPKQEERLGGMGLVGYTGKSTIPVTITINNNRSYSYPVGTIVSIDRGRDIATFRGVPPPVGGRRTRRRKTRRHKTRRRLTR